MSRRVHKGEGFPRRVGLIPPTRSAIERECRALWNATSLEQKRRWQVSYTYERTGKAHHRPVVDPDDIFGPGSPTVHLTVRSAYKQASYWPPPWKNRDKTVVATFLGLRWAVILLDPCRREEHIQEDVAAEIPRLRKWAGEKFPNRKRPGAGMIYAWAFCYYHRLSGMPRAATAQRVFGKTDRASMKRVDAMVESFLHEVHPNRRPRPVK